VPFYECFDLPHAASRNCSLLLIKTGSLDRLALKETEHDFDLVQPTGRSRREVELHPLVEFRRPVVVFLMRRVVVQDHGNVFVRRQLRQHAVKEALENSSRFLIAGGLGVHLAVARFESGEQLQRAVAFVGALQRAHHGAAIGLDVTAGPLDGLDARLFVYVQHQRIHWRVQVQPTISAALGANSLPVLTHQLRALCR